MRARRSKVHEAKLADDVAEAVARSHARAIKETQRELEERQCAYGRITGTTGALTYGYNVARTERTAAGTYVVTLAEAIDPHARFITLTSRAAGGTALLELDPALETPTQFRIYAIDTFTTPGTPTLADFNFAFRVEAWD